MNEDTEKQGEKQAFDPVKNIAPYMWKKGQSGNPKGRPKGLTMKEWLREYFQTMTDEEREEYLEGINKIDLFKMAEGNPAQETKVDAKIEVDYDPELKQKVETNIKGLLNIPNEQLTN